MFKYFLIPKYRIYTHTIQIIIIKTYVAILTKNKNQEQYYFII